jgi:hypothetical protein
MVKIPVPFPAARAEEAAAATSQSFKDITLRRVNQPDFKSAAKAFIKAFEDARKTAVKKLKRNE